jgi:hypothetical protein
MQRADIPREREATIVTAASYVLVVGGASIEDGQPR